MVDVGRPGASAGGEKPLTVGAADKLISVLLAGCDFPPAGTTVPCAVSGGADSLALLVLATSAKLDVTAIYVDHGLRASSSSDAETAKSAAAGLRSAFEVRMAIVEPGPNLEARARAARYAALPPGTLTGHTADDLAETILVNLLRGAGLDGLAPMGGAGGRHRDRGWHHDGDRTVDQVGGRSGGGFDVRRPLLGLRRAQTRALCQAVGLSPLQDPSNQDRRFVRNRIRLDLLPLLQTIAGRDPVPVLVRQAEVIRAEVAVLEELASGLDPTDCRALATAPAALARRALRRWLRMTSDAECHPPSSAEVERVLDVARGLRLGCELAGGRRVRRSAGRLSLT